MIATTLRRTGALLLAAALGACASTDDGSGGFAAQDPYEDTNRVFHSFNVGLDSYVLRPAAQAYDVIAYGPIQHIVGNGLDHLELPADFANYLFQGEGRMALRTLGRFTLNTAMGAGGLLDPATEFGLPHEPTDFGVTLGKYGVAQGPYLVLPLLGPSSPRALAGFAVDTGLTPTTYVGLLETDALSNIGPIITVTDNVDQRDENFDLIDELLYESPDSYVTLRSVYLQRRQALIGGEDAAAPDIFDDEGQ
ncbi:MAG: VacJ family lipoprotein [Paracoccaceae bacterium]